MAHCLEQEVAAAGDGRAESQGNQDEYHQQRYRLDDPVPVRHIAPVHGAVFGGRSTVETVTEAEHGEGHNGPGVQTPVEKCKGQRSLDRWSFRQGVVLEVIQGLGDGPVEKVHPQTCAIEHGKPGYESEAGLCCVAQTPAPQRTDGDQNHEI